MRWSITVGSVAGTAVRIHVTFLLLLAWIFGGDLQPDRRPIAATGLKDKAAGL